jgi:hypothetical protein
MRSNRRFRVRVQADEWATNIRATGISCEGTDQPR